MRPADLLSIEDPLLAFQVDELVGLFGNWCHSQMDRQEGKTPDEIRGKREAALNTCLGIPVKYRSIRAAAEGRG